MIKYLTFILTLFIVTPAFGSDTTCFDPNWKQVRYENDNRGTVVFFITPVGYKHTATNLACVFGIEFLQTVNEVPEKAVIGLISEDYREVHLLQWNLKEDYLLMLESSIPQTMRSWSGTYVKYPAALDRIKEIIINKPFPKPQELSPHLRARLKTNFIETTIDGNKKLVEE